MDFKVAGTSDGITALQMDIKLGGISLEVLKEALYQAKRGREHILALMTQADKNIEIKMVKNPIKALKTEPTNYDYWLDYGGYKFKAAALCFYLLCLVPIFGLFLQVFFVIYFSHFFFLRETSRLT